MKLFNPNKRICYMPSLGGSGEYGGDDVSGVGDTSGGESGADNAGEYGNEKDQGRKLNKNINPATEYNFDLNLDLKSKTTNVFGLNGIESHKETTSSFDFDFDELTFSPYDKTKQIETFGSIEAHLYEAGLSMQEVQTIDTITELVSLYMTIIGIPTSFSMLQMGKVIGLVGAVKLATEIHDIVSTIEKLGARYGITNSDFEMEFDKHYGGDGDTQFALQKSTEVLVAEARATKTQLSDFLYGNLFDWMPGGIFYAAIYAGGNFFNSTGSLAQTRFVGNGDKNMNDELWLRMGVYGETPRKKLGSLAGDEGFSVVNFGG